MILLVKNGMRVHVFFSNFQLYLYIMTKCDVQVDRDVYIGWKEFSYLLLMYFK